MPSPNWLGDMIKNEATLTKKAAWKFFKGQGFGCGGSGESGHNYGSGILNGAKCKSIANINYGFSVVAKDGRWSFSLQQLEKRELRNLKVSWKGSCDLISLLVSKSLDLSFSIPLSHLKLESSRRFLFFKIEVNRWESLFCWDEDSCYDYEECPICFLYYPSLNRSRCCKKGICTECFLQMKNPNSTRPTQCPFCKTTNYAVEYKGVKSKEAKGLEQIEEQRVIEAKIRMRQQELQDDEERTQKRSEVSSSSTNIAPGDLECGPAAVLSDRAPVESEEIVSSPYSIRHPLHSGGNRGDEFDLDLEDIMVMEAIWLSIQVNCL
ncbi:hypothetical protein OIU84_002784 [Salix udensis]|uniref:RING-type domain-containing protein n=1 Tax=Salix udensis TaxID=889485 RepID=A0AAD6P4Z5_9ROSI|nr:hypothetical protein OIU84_002784 [Salix udensis]